MNYERITLLMFSFYKYVLVKKTSLNQDFCGCINHRTHKKMTLIKTPLFYQRDCQ